MSAMFPAMSGIVLKGILWVVYLKRFSVCTKRLAGYGQKKPPILNQTQVSFSFKDLMTLLRVHITSPILIYCPYLHNIKQFYQTVESLRISNVFCSKKVNSDYKAWLETRAKMERWKRISQGAAPDPGAPGEFNVWADDQKGAETEVTKPTQQTVTQKS